ncbi:Hypothetical predicted protein [Paramuricea clavata]|uniref:Uncharacterized protein n=1 Tax=Paramuricea clavata TaxID=317549 RepID=A0A6S7IIF1_PARCT|nr:Hypothetical predicted protein [Paramuricea clavata]
MNVDESSIVINPRKIYKPRRRFGLFVKTCLHFLVKNKKTCFPISITQLEDDNRDEGENVEGQQNIKQTVDRHPSWSPTFNLKFESGCVNGGFPLRKIPSRSFQAILDPNLPPDQRQNYRRKPKMPTEEKRCQERQLLVDFANNEEAILDQRRSMFFRVGKAWDRC